MSAIPLRKSCKQKKYIYKNIHKPADYVFVIILMFPLNGKQHLIIVFAFHYVFIP